MLATAAATGSVAVVDLLLSHGAVVNELLGMDDEEVILLTLCAGLMQSNDIALSASEPLLGLFAH